MLGSLGFPEILFILVLALLVFGPRRLPEVGRKVGRALGEFRRATGDLKRSIDREMTMADMAVKGSPPESTQPRYETEQATAPVADAEPSADESPAAESVDD
jgi:TatA/E family protein of Tat protein translocase